MLQSYCNVSYTILFFTKSTQGALITMASKFFSIAFLTYFFYCALAVQMYTQF